MLTRPGEVEPNLLWRHIDKYFVPKEVSVPEASSLYLILWNRRL